MAARIPALREWRSKMRKIYLGLLIGFLLPGCAGQAIQRKDRGLGGLVAQGDFIDGDIGR